MMISLAVRNISLKAGKGEIIGFLGPNGAGKTTTMRLILGYLTPSEGAIEVSGLNPIKNRSSLLKSIGYLPENNPLYSDMKVKEYLSFIGSVKNDVNIEKVRDLVDLKEVWNKKIEVLSRGYKQRVGLAAALLGNPEILILDEPTSGLDPIEQDKIKTLIKKLAKDKTVLFSTHILSEVEAIATRLIIINRGQVVYDGKKPAGRGAVETLFKKVVKS
jgi:ABC-2 type transport system ATP-binding protein